jgi:hypothetical protein
MPQLNVAAAIRQPQPGAFLFPEHWHTRFSDARTNCRRGNRPLGIPKKKSWRRDAACRIVIA